MSFFRSSLTRTTRATAPIASRPAFTLRTYAAKQNMQADQGQASPGTASNVGNPQASSSDAQDVNKSRATDERVASPDTASVQNPVSNPKGAQVGQQTEDTSMHETMKQDPNKPDAEKRRNVEEKGQRPLDPADK